MERKRLRIEQRGWKGRMYMDRVIKRERGRERGRSNALRKMRGIGEMEKRGGNGKETGTEGKKGRTWMKETGKPEELRMES